jgi:pimeloyl-ACP methyl ester carboxylesterase
VITDPSEILIRGPWRHRFLAANGARFHVAETGTGPLVLLLHGFPQFWWTWRHQLTALAEAGFRAVAMDLRGYGASDKPPRGYDTPTLAADVAGVIRTLGETSAVVAGQGWGGWVAWSMPSLAPQVTRAIVPLGAGHPLRMRRLVPLHLAPAALLPLLRFQLPLLPERDLRSEEGVGMLLRAWSGPGFPDPRTEAVYRRAMRVPFVAHTSVEYHRWAVRSLWRQDGRRFAGAVRRPVTVPVLHMVGSLDPWCRPECVLDSGSWVHGPLRRETILAAGHYLTEEAPEQVSATLIDWLRALDR